MAAEPTLQEQWGAIQPEEGTIAWHVRRRSEQDANAFVEDRTSEEWYRCALHRHEEHASLKEFYGIDLLDYWQSDEEFAATQCSWCVEDPPVENTGMCAVCLVDMRASMQQRFADGSMVKDW